MSIPEPFDQGWLDVGDGHRIYYEQSGNPQGIPIVLLHGGPGDGSRPSNRRFFDGQIWRLIMFDQRGAGKSLPTASLEANTTQHLLRDIEHLRAHLDIQRWAVSGGSWGSLLALAYAIAFPQNVLGLILRGVVLGGRDQVDWWFQGREIVFPDLHKQLRTYLPESEQHSLLHAYHRRLIDPDPAVHLPAAQRLRAFMLPMTRLVPAESTMAAPDPQHALNIGRLWTHYCMNDFFLPADHVLNHIRSLHTLPAIIVQGRYDMVTPFRAAYRLAQAWPQAGLIDVRQGGHSADDPAISDALCAAHRDMAAQLSEHS